MSAHDDTLRRVAEIEPSFDYRIGPPAEPGWQNLGAAIADDVTLEQWFERHRAMWPGNRRDVGGSYLAWALSRLVTRNLIISVCTMRRGWTLKPDQLWVKVADASDIDHDDEHDHIITGLAVGARLISLPNDVASTDPTAIVVADDEALIERAADEITGALTPIFAAIRTGAPYGQTGM